MTNKQIPTLRQRMMEDISLRHFGEKTQKDYIRHIENISQFLGHPPDQASGEDIRRYQLHLTTTGASPYMINAAVSALRFFMALHWGAILPDIPAGCANHANYQ